MKNRRILLLLFLIAWLLSSITPVSANPATSSQAGPEGPAATNATIPLDIKVVADSPNQMDDVSMVMVGDSPWIAYYDTVDKALKVAHSLGGATTGNCGPNNSHTWQCDTLDSGGDIGRHPSIAYFPGSGTLHFNWKIGITYDDNTGLGTHYLKYTYYHCTLIVPITCGWEAPVRIGVNITRSSLKYDANGNEFVGMYEPAVSSVYITSPLYTNGINCAPDYPGLNDPWKCRLLETFPILNVDSYVSLDLDILGHPDLAYYDPVQHSLRFAYYTLSGTGSCLTHQWECVTIDAGGTNEDEGMAVQLHIPKHINSEIDIITFAYYEKLHGELMIAQPVRPGMGGNCGASSPPYPYSCYSTALMTWNSANPQISMVTDPNGYPYIAFVQDKYGSASAVLWVAYPNLNSKGTCGRSYLFYQWQCETVYRDNTATYWSPSIGLYSTGQYAVSYVWLYSNTHHLTITKRDVSIFLPAVLR